VETVASLVDALGQSRLLSPGQLQELTPAYQARFSHPKGLAKDLIDRGWLTPYQVNQLFQGRGSELTLGPYVLLERLGDGAMGPVFKARHQHMKRAVAINVVRDDLLLQTGVAERFFNEIQAASRLADPHIIHAYDAGLADQTHYFVTEFVGGIDLEQLVQESGPLSIELTCEYLRQTLVGLQHAFEHHLRHHDLTPGNLIVTQKAGLSDSGEQPKLGSPAPSGGGFIKIRNLGLSSLQSISKVKTGSSSQVVLAGEMPGSPDYLAPETFDAKIKKDVRASLYSLGCTFYYALTGQVPFPGGGVLKKATCHRQEQPEPVTRFRPEVPPELVALLDRLMAKRPEERFHTPADVLDALAQAPHVPVAVNPAAVNPAPEPAPEVAEEDNLLARRRERQARDRRRLVRITLVGGGVLLLCVGLLIYLWIELSKPVRIPGPPPKGPPPSASLVYVRKPTRQETILATLAKNGYPTLQGKWYYIGPFDNPGGKGFGTPYPPETEIDLQKTYPGKGGLTAAWKEFPNFRVGTIVDLALFPNNNDQAAVYLHHEIEATKAVALPVSLGSDDTLTVWLNGKQLLANNVQRGAAPDQDHVTLELVPGKNRFLAKICNGTGPWAFYIFPLFPPELQEPFGDGLKQDFK
jgi:serine/threonine-protein kinase